MPLPNGNPTESEVQNALAHPNMESLQGSNLPGYVTPTNTAISVDQLNPVAPLTVPPAPPTTNPLETTAAGAQSTSKSLADYIKELTPPESETSAQYDKLSSDISSLLPGLGGRGQAQVTAEADAGLPELKKSLASLNSQILTMVAEANKSNAAYDAEIARIETQPGMLTSISLGQQGAVRKLQMAEANKRSSDINLLQARALGLQGEISAAQSYIDRAIDLKYKDREDELDLKMKQLGLLEGKLNKEEQITSKALERKYNEEQQKIAEQKDKEKAIQSVMLEAAKFGADSDTLSKIQKSGNVGEAIAKSGKFLSAEFNEKLKQQQFDNKIKLENLAIDRAKLALERYKADQDNSVKTDIPTLVAYAQQYASTGAIPTGLPKGSFGAVSEIAKSLPKPNGTLVDKNTGIKPSSLSASQMDGITALYDLNKKLTDAKDLFNQYHHGVIAGLKNQVFPSQAKQQYGALRSEISDLLARARTGAAITAFEEKQYRDKLPGDFNQLLFLGSKGNTSIDSLKSSLTGKLNSTLDVNGTSIYGYSKVKIGDTSYSVGDIISNGTQNARVNPDGTLSLVSE